MERELRQQTKKIAELQSANAQLKEVIEGIQLERQKKGKNQNVEWKEKVKILEEKINQLEEKVKEKEQSPNDTFSRGSRADSPPDILLDTNRLESAPHSEARSSHTILDDPLIREMYERKRQMFLLQQRTREPAGEVDSQPQISPTMTSTYMSNKHV